MASQTELMLFSSDELSRGYNIDSYMTAISCRLGRNTIHAPMAFMLGLTKETFICNGWRLSDFLCKRTQ